MHKFDGRRWRDNWGLLNRCCDRSRRLVVERHQYQGQDGKGSSVTSGCLAKTAACPRIGGLAGGNDASVNQVSVSYTYPLSKRTSIYTGWVLIDNDAAASYNFGVGNYPNATTTGGAGNLAIGGRPQGFMFGMWHNF